MEIQKALAESMNEEQPAAPAQGEKKAETADGKEEPKP